MTPREVDARVAERVMQRDPCDHSDGGCEGLCVVPPYSSTGDGMLAVVEAMRGKGFSWSMASHDGNGSPSVYFELPREDGLCSLPPRARGSSHNDPLPRAVCLAALRALGEEV